MLCSQIMLGVVHGVKTSGCELQRFFLTLLFSGKGDRLLACTCVCVCVGAVHMCMSG